MQNFAWLWNPTNASENVVNENDFENDITNIVLGNPNLSQLQTNGWTWVIANFF